MTPDPSLQGAVERARRLAARLDRPEFGAGWARYPSEATIADAEAIRAILAALPERSAAEKIVWHAMTAMSGSNLTLEQAKAAPPSVDGNYNLLYLSNAVDALAALPEPPTEDADAVGCAEREVGRAIYERIEALMSSAKDATPEGRELSYLADLVASVEEYGSWNGPTEPIAVPDDVIEIAARTHYNHHYGPEGWDSLTDRARRRLTFRMRAALPEPPSKSAESGEREGWVLVPREPGACELDDSGWLLAFMVALHSRVADTHPIMGWADFDDEQRDRIANAYRAMIAAAPKPPEKPR